MEKTSFNSEIIAMLLMAADFAIKHNRRLLAVKILRLIAELETRTP